MREPKNPIDPETGKPKRGRPPYKSSGKWGPIEGTPLDFGDTKVSDLTGELHDVLVAAIEEQSGLRSKMGRLLRPVADETWNFLQDVARTVRYRDFLHLKAQTFEQIRALALSDEFEELTEPARRQIADDQRRAELRAMAEYTTIKDRMRAEAVRMAGIEDTAEGWLDAAAPHARRQISQVLKQGGRPEHVLEAAQQVMDRAHPKQTRQQSAELMVVNLAPGFEQTLTKALRASEEAEREVKQIGPVRGGHS